MSDLDVKRVADIAAYVERHASPAGEQRMWNAGKDFDLNCSTCRERFLLRRLADRERQLANTKFELEITENARLTDNAYLIQQREAAEAKLRAVAALRDELRDPKQRPLRHNCSEYMLGGLDREEELARRLDAILGGDK